MPKRPGLHRPSGWAPKQPWQHAPGMGSATKRGYGAEWAKLRAEVLADEPFCREHMKRGEFVRATHVDHIVGKAAGGSNDRANLQALCAACHLTKSGREGKEASKVIIRGWKT